MDFIEFTFWLNKEMKDRGIPGSATIRFIDLSFSGINTGSISIDYDRELNSVEIRDASTTNSKW